ncbi:PocR ligand-binding domain-containing protein [Desulfovibrio sp.]|uniref:helix-turn-helix transcriptional regulator n=1 Tax=Desulfovibrio sp. TaxID=885 RepID=UPI00260C5F80|nr:PocR ligand-binding domain-containing protein [Desulfovibrio sp.]
MDKKGAYSVIVEFDTEKIKSLMAHFYTVTHIQVGIFRADYSVVFTYPANCNKVCNWIHESREGLLRCDLSGIAGLSACQTSGKRMHIWRCHAGFLECGLPVYVRSEIAGYIIFGQFIDDSVGERENIFRRCADLLDDQARLAALLDELQVFNMGFIEAAAQLMAGCLHSVLLEDAFRIHDDPIWMRIDRYIDDNLHTPLRLEMIAEHNFVSPSTVSHKVKKATGKSVGEVIQSRRMVQARNYLVRTDIKISEIALMVGIPDYNYFSRMFRKTYDYSPSKYRKHFLLQKKSIHQ